MNVSFERKKNGKDEWLTPPYILDALGEFDLDPCSPTKRPWHTAETHFTKRDNGLTKRWFGRVWCNPPYGNQTDKWLAKCVKHKNAIALVFARTETKMFFKYIWEKADAVLFIKGRLKFYHKNGVEGDSAGAPSVLVAYGKANVKALLKSKISGVFIQLR
jgi:phage N-6-adenine-methyltransferase